FGLSAIRNVGAHVVEGIIAAREEKGPFTSFEDFLDKVPLAVCNKRTIESLIKGGAFDSLGQNRRSLTLVHEEAVESVVKLKRQENIGQFDLFGAALEDTESPMGSLFNVPELPEWERKEKLSFERNMLGLYISDHPLSGLEHVIAENSSHPIASLAEEGAVSDGAQIKVAGLITGIQRKTTKKGDPWAIVTVEDLEGSLDCLLFPSTYQTVGAMLAEDLVVTMSGRIDLGKGTPELRAMEVTILDVSESASDAPLVISLPANRCTPGLAQELRDVLHVHPGKIEVWLRLQQPGRTTVMRLEKRLCVTPSTALYASLKALLGPGCIGG
ncbi:helix-hairpin-helix domain-containing protein, partial [Dermabacteraceae bacterium P13101]